MTVCNGSLIQHYCIWDFFFINNLEKKWISQDVDQYLISNKMETVL
jgi:hypothetical protein